MALIAVNPFALWNCEIATGQLLVLLDANGEKCGIVFQAPKTGTIDRVSFRTGTITTGDTLTVTLETIDASGFPSGTLWGTNTSGTQVEVTATNSKLREVTLTAGASVTQGDILALVVSLPASGSIGNINISHWNGASAATAGFPYCVSNLTGSYSKFTNRWWHGGVRYSDGTYPPVIGMLPIADGASQPANSNFNNSATPDERGIKMTIPFACKATGIWHRPATATLGDYQIKVYNLADSVLASITMDGDVYQASSATGIWHLFNTELTFAAGDVIRITKLPTTATNTGEPIAWDLKTGMGTQSPMGLQSGTSRTDAGSWTDSAERLVLMGLVISALSAP